MLLSRAAARERSPSTTSASSSNRVGRRPLIVDRSAVLDGGAARLAGRVMQNPQVHSPRIRGFICVNAHPGGCAANVDRQIAVARAGAAGSAGQGFGAALV